MYFTLFEIDQFRVFALTHLPGSAAFQAALSMMLLRSYNFALILTFSLITMNSRKVALANLLICLLNLPKLREKPCSLERG